MEQPELFGPLAALEGTWEGEGGVDVSFHHAEGDIGQTAYRERCSFSPFGPVDNGTQCLYGLDYRGAMWRGDEVNPFHTEIGYWLWDAADGLVMRSFMVPRGVAVLAGGVAEPDATAFTVRAQAGTVPFGVLENPYLAKAARTVRYEMTVRIGDDGTLSYEQNTVLEMLGRSEHLDHTDRNVLRRVD